MNIVMITRTTHYSAPGGDTIQIESTAKYLRKLGVKVDIKLTNHPIQYTKYDLLHFFNIIRPANLLYHAKKSKKPYVVSPIFVDYEEYEKKTGVGIRSILFRFLPSDTIEYIKTIGRRLKNQEKIMSKVYLYQGHRHSVKYLLKKAHLILPNSQSEYDRLFKKYGIRQSYRIIPNAIDSDIFKEDITDFWKKSGIICVGRIEGIKNQLNLIKAMKDMPYKLTLIGKPSPNHMAYYEKCRSKASSNVQFIDHVNHQTLISYYQKAKVHVLASWFETTGLSTLEAAVMGCNVVITAKGDTREYFKDYAFYCEPDDVLSIQKAIEKACHTPYNEEFRAHILNNFTWELAAKKTFEAYRDVLKIKKS